MHVVRSFVTERHTAGQEHSYPVLGISKKARDRTRSAYSEQDPRCGRCDVIDRDRRKRLSRHGVYYHALERGAGGARSNARGTSRTRKTLPHVLATDLWFRAATGGGAEETKDLTQGFFALLLERRDLNTVRKEKGRLRSYLLTSLKHFLTNERSRAMAIKRGEGQRLIPLEDLHEREAVGFGPTDILTAEQIYERGWALALLDQVLTRLGDEYRAGGPATAGLFDQLQKLLTDESDRPSQAEIAGELAMTENAVKQAFHRLRQRYRELLREEIAHTVMLPGDIEDELRHLIAVLRA